MTPRSQRQVLFLEYLSEADHFPISRLVLFISIDRVCLPPGGADISGLAAIDISKRKIRLSSSDYHQGRWETLGGRGETPGRLGGDSLMGKLMEHAPPCWCPGGCQRFCEMSNSNMKGGRLRRRFKRSYVYLLC